MAKGIIYAMDTVVNGLVKIGKTGIDNFEQRMNQLESNGYQNVTGLKRRFAIQVDNYDQKEMLIHNLFDKSRVGKTELFSVDIDLVIQLLSSLEGLQVYPKNESKEASFEIATEKREEKVVLSAKTIEKEVMQKSFQVSKTKYERLIRQRRGKELLLEELIKEWGIKIKYDCINAFCFGVKGYYWMEPYKDVLIQNWLFGLIDTKGNEISIFLIPSNTFTTNINNGLKLRKSDPEKLEMKIYKEAYWEYYSKKSFEKFLLYTIKLDVV